MREEIRHDRQWVVRLRELPDTPETFYLTELMASHDFQTALHNYLDLEELRVKLQRWQGGFGAHQDLVAVRRAYYGPLLPVVDDQFRALDSRIRLRRQQAELIERRMQELLVMPKPEMLATTEERVTVLRLADFLSQLDGREDVEAAALRARIGRLQGLMIWQIRTRYDERLTQLHTHLGELRGALATLEETYAAYLRVRQAATHSYEGYAAPFKRLAVRVGDKHQAVEQLMQRQGQLLERIAIAELKQRRERLEEFQNTARFAMADSYDRATKALQAGAQ